MFAPLALASLAVITYLRQNLVISSSLFSLPRLLPPRVCTRSLWDTYTGGVADAAAGAFNPLPGAQTAAAPLHLPTQAAAATDAQPQEMSFGSRSRDFFAYIVWLLNGLPGQLAALSIFLAFVSKTRIPVSTCYSLGAFTTVQVVYCAFTACSLPAVLHAVLFPAFLMVVYKLGTVLSADETSPSSSNSSSRHASVSSRGSADARNQRQPPTATTTTVHPREVFLADYGY
jgi:hypothetical protein